MEWFKNPKTNLVNLGKKVKKKRKKKDSHFDGDPEHLLSASSPVFTGLFHSLKQTWKTAQEDFPQLSKQFTVSVLFHVKEVVWIAVHQRKDRSGRDSKKRERQGIEGLLSWISFIHGGISGWTMTQQNWPSQMSQFMLHELKSFKMLIRKHWC